MSILETLIGMLESLGIPVETGVFSGRAPDTYVVLTPVSDTFDGFADAIISCSGVNSPGAKKPGKGEYFIVNKSMKGGSRQCPAIKVYPV